MQGPAVVERGAAGGERARHRGGLVHAVGHEQVVDGVTVVEAVVQDAPGV